MYGFESTAITPQAHRLAQALADRVGPESVPVLGAPLRDDEHALAVLTLDGWRYVGQADCAYERRAVLVGGPALLTACALASAIGNRRRRNAAQRAAAPQWRPLGALRVVATSERLLVWHQGSWWSVWLSTITDMTVDARAGALVLCFVDDAPYRFAGPGADHLAVFVAWRRENLAGKA
jgi:hypothetical protein